MIAVLKTTLTLIHVPVLCLSATNLRPYAMDIDDAFHRYLDPCG